MVSAWWLPVMFLAGWLGGLLTVQLVRGLGREPLEGGRRRDG